MDQRRAAVTSEPGATVLVLSQPEFEESVRAALRGLSRPAMLAGNPLLSPTLVLRVLRANLRRRRDAPVELDRPAVASHVG